MRALLIDDSRAQRSMVRNMLRDVGFDVVEAGNGQEGLTQLEDSQPIDLVIVDWNMPVMDGLEFINRTRDNARWLDLPILMATSETDSSQVLRAIMAGANEYLMKPYDKASLLDKLALLGLA